MANNRGCGGCALLVLAVSFLPPLAVLLLSPAIAAHIATNDVPAQDPFLSQWLWAAAASLPLGMLLVRFVLKKNGRVRRRPPVKRWRDLLAYSAVLIGAMNAVALLMMKPSEPGGHVIEDGIEDGMSFLFGAAAAGIAVLVAIRLWDRRARRVTVREVRAATAEADRTLRRVRAENQRVRRQAEQVQARLVKLRARSAGPPGHPRTPRQSDVEFHSLRVFHRESYQCADTAHLAYQSAQTSLDTMSHLVRRARVAPHHLVASRRARAEMQAAAAQLAQSQGELRSHVEQGLGMVRTLNANTSELKHEIRDSCGAQGQQWFEALEERIEERRTSRTR